MTREIAAWDLRNLKAGPTAKKRIDSGNSVLMPRSDPDTGLIYLTSRGDSSLRIWEHAPKLRVISNVRLGGNPARDVCLVP